MAIVIFFIFTLIILFVPGAVFLSIAGIEYRRMDPLIMFGLSTTLGMIAITLFAFFVRFLGFSNAFVTIIPILSITFILIKQKKYKKSIFAVLTRVFTRTHRVILMVLVLGVLTQNLALFRGGIAARQGYLYPSLHDTMWNVALANELYHHYPPQHPAMSGVLLKNNHYFYPLFLSIARSLTQIDTISLYYRFGPILVSLLFGISLYALASQFNTNTFFRAIALFLGYFSGNAAFVLPLILEHTVDWRGSSFFADQPFDQIINPYSVFGFTLLLFVAYCLFEAFRQKERTHKAWIIMSSIFVSTLFGFKAFGGVIAVFSYFFAFCVFSLRRKSLALVLPTIFTIAFAYIIFALTTTAGAKLRWAPGWILTQMLSSDKLNMLGLVQIESYYRDIGNFLGLFKLKLFELSIYLLGNLGVRILGIGALIWIGIKKSKFYEKFEFPLLFIWSAIISSIGIPLLFNLGANAYNIVQFTPYALVVLAIVTAFGAYLFRLHFTRRKHFVIGNLIVIIIVFLAIPVNVKNILSKLGMPEHVIPREEVHALWVVREKSNPEDVILIDPTQFNNDPIYVSALSERRLYLGSNDYIRQTGNDPTDRLVSVKKIFQESESTPKDLGIPFNFVYILKPHTNKNIQTMFESQGFTVLFENSRVLILNK